MIYMFILFFFFVYAICETFKYDKWKTVKLNTSEKGRIYRKSAVIIKFVSIILCYMLVIINRFLNIGILEKSSGIKGFLITSAVFFVLIALSFYDLKIYKNSNKKLLKNIKENEV